MGTAPSPGSGPVRTCVGCRERGPRSGLVRIVAVEGTVLVLDERGGAPGRGAWLHVQERCLDRALARHALPRALRLQGADASQVEAALRAAIRSR
ncbi:DUF448 domain-containing protein [Serinibacter arcticus]|uniref:DUF448 domain-containing protein n=1 Tax=Serinibacter arcticus TaxID=1655435 RepID=A0A2U1ZZE8_9MICO|nr:DUF448 domain-containing protein [Serinibacter arcticus]